MAVRQYVGARYVPKYDGDWDITKTYEPLTIVTVQNVGSYTSKKTVPAGTQITDTEYWALSGATSGQIIQIQQEIDDIEDKINREILIIGNSFVQAGVADELAALFDHSYKKTSGGVGFVAFTGHTTTFETLLDSAISDVNIDNDKITDVIFCSAVGDSVAYTELGSSSYGSALATNLDSIVNKIKTNFTNCRHIKCTLAESRNNKGTSTNAYNAPFNIHMLFRQNMTRHGIEYIGWSGFNIWMQGATYFEADNTHPNSTGAAVIATWIKTAYFGKADYNTFIGIESDIPMKYTAASKGVIYYELTPDSVTVDIQTVVLGVGDPVTLGAGDTFLDTHDMVMPLPMMRGVINVYSPLIQTGNGSIIEMLRFQTFGGADNCFSLKNINAPSQATAPVNGGVLQTFTNFSYKI